MDDNKFQETFLKIKDRVGFAVRIMRLRRFKEPKELANILKNDDNWLYITGFNIETIERGGRDVTFEEFEDICKALNFDVEHGLRIVSSDYSEFSDQELKVLLKKEAEDFLRDFKQQSE